MGEAMMSFTFSNNSLRLAIEMTIHLKLSLVQTLFFKILYSFYKYSNVTLHYTALITLIITLIDMSSYVATYRETSSKITRNFIIIFFCSHNNLSHPQKLGKQRRLAVK